MSLWSLQISVISCCGSILIVMVMKKKNKLNKIPLLLLCRKLVNSRISSLRLKLRAFTNIIIVTAQSDLYFAKKNWFIDVEYNEIIAGRPPKHLPFSQLGLRANTANSNNWVTCSGSRLAIPRDIIVIRGGGITHINE